MRNCEPLRDFQKMCQVLLTISGGIMRSCESLRDFQKMCQVLLTISKKGFHEHVKDHSLNKYHFDIGGVSLCNVLNSQLAIV